MKSLFPFYKRYRKQSSIVPNHVGPVKQLWLNAVVCVGLSCLFILNANGAVNTVETTPGSVNTVETMRGSNETNKQRLLSRMESPAVKADKDAQRVKDTAQAMLDRANQAAKAAMDAADRAVQAAQAGDSVAAQNAASEARNAATKAAEAAKEAQDYANGGNTAVPTHGEELYNFVQNIASLANEALKKAQAAADRANQAAQNAANNNTQVTNTGTNNNTRALDPNSFNPLTTVIPQSSPYTMGGGGAPQPTQTTRCRADGQLCSDGSECCSGRCDFWGGNEKRCQTP
jgi:hypothetical protein